MKETYFIHDFFEVSVVYLFFVNVIADYRRGVVKQLLNDVDSNLLVD